MTAPSTTARGSDHEHARRRSEHVRVAMVSAHYAPFVGGVEAHVANLAAGLRDLGVRVEVLTQNDDSAWPTVDEIDGVVVRRFPVPVPSRNFAVSPALARYVRAHRLRFDVVHAHQYHNFPAVAAAVADPPALVFTPHYHGTGHSPFRAAVHRPYRIVGRGVVRRADRIICVSRPEADLLAGHFPSARSRITVLPGGVDREAIARAEPWPERHPTILVAGRMERYKQIDRVIDAMTHLTGDERLVISGGGPDRERLEHRARRRGVAHRVRFLGRVSTTDLHRWYRTAAVLVSMSTQEAQGLIIGEAVAAGAPVVASAIPAHEDLASWSGGFVELVPPTMSPPGLARVIYQTMTRRGSGAPVGVPDWSDVATRTLALYETVMRSRRGL